MKKIFLPFLISVGILTGCASYHAKPLDQSPTLLNKVPHIIVDTKTLPLPELARHRFDPSDGLDMTEVAMLAVVNNPDLKASRDEAGISRAQAFAAGLLPDPVLNLSYDAPTVSGPGITSAYSFGLSYDIKALFVRPAKKAAASEDIKKTDLNILWKEWQVVGQARLLFVKALYQEKLMKVLREEKALFSERYERSKKLFDAGNMTVDSLIANLIAFQDADRKLKELDRQISQTRHDLNALLGLSPEVKLDLVGETALPELDAERIKKEMDELPRRRPDLMALAAGYQSQEQKLRQAVLAQFPDLTIGVTSARDTSNVSTIGVGINMSLPVFDGNRGNIAIEDATRQKVYDEYHARLDAAYGEISAALAGEMLLEMQLKEADEALPELQAAAKNAEKAYRQGNIDILLYTTVQTSLYDKRAEALGLRESMEEERVQLLTLTGGELPEKAAGAGK
jgi:outer membrane protein, heavy metal efflux system